MTLQQLKYVIAVADTGTLTKAAKQLFISQPSLTNSIHALEKEMNTADVKMIKSIKDDSFYRIERVRSRSNKSAYCGFYTVLFRGK